MLSGKKKKLYFKSSFSIANNIINTWLFEDPGTFILGEDQETEQTGPSISVLLLPLRTTQLS